MKAGIKFKLIMFMASLLTIVIFVLSAFVLQGIKSYQDKEVQAVLFKQKDMFEQLFNEEIVRNNKVDIARGTIFNKPWLRTIPACLYDVDGNLLSGFNNDSTLEDNNDKGEMIKLAKEGKISYKEMNNIAYFYTPLKYKDSTISILELKYSVEDRNEFYKNIRIMFEVTGLAALFIGITIAAIFISSFTKEIYKMRNYVNEIQKGNFVKLDLKNRDDELGELSKGLICMSNTIEKNINDLKIERDTLSVAVDKLKKMDKKQKEFIGNVTHEFKTPITIIKASGDLIEMYPDDFSLIEDGTSRISKECDRLESLVESVLKLSALEKYDFEIEKKEINLKVLLDDICNRMKGRIIRNNLTLKSELNDIVITADEESLKHIVINLIDNAIKYNSNNGFIEIRSYKEDNMAFIEVEDSGMGIPEEKLQMIFEPFYRVDKNRSRKQGGTGLGLALVKKLVVKQGGTIEAKSKLNKGSCFLVKFPL